MFVGSSPLRLFSIVLRFFIISPPSFPLSKCFTDLLIMQLTIPSLLAVLAVSTSALDIRRQSNDTEVRVILSSQATETGSQVAFDSVTQRVFDTPTGSSTLFETIEVSVGAGAQQDLRCQAIGMGGMPLVATRGENV